MIVRFGGQLCQSWVVWSKRIRIKSIFAGAELVNNTVLGSTSIRSVRPVSTSLVNHRKMVSKLTQDERNTQLQPLFGKGSNNFPSLHRLSKIISYPVRMDHGEG